MDASHVTQWNHQMKLIHITRLKDVTLRRFPLHHRLPIPWDIIAQWRYSTS
jgi:hypothetical protein